MVNIVTVMDDHFMEGDKKIFPSSLVVLKIIPDLYLRQANQERIIVSEATQRNIKTLSQKDFPLIRVDYWSSSFGKDHMGRIILVRFKGNLGKFLEKGLFYRDRDIIFFQRLPKDADPKYPVSLMGDYLRRYGITLPEGPIIQHDGKQSRGDILWGIVQDEFHNLKLKLLQRKNHPHKNIIDPLLGLFCEHKRSFWRDLITKTSLGVLISLSGIGTMGLYWDRLAHLEEIGRLQLEIIPLTPKQLKIGQIFDKLKTYQQNRTPISFDFAQIIISTWQNRLVITAMEWGIEEGEAATQYTLSFNPEEKGENDFGAVEQFVDWIETQHPRVQIKEKDTQNGSIHIMVPTL